MIFYKVSGTETHLLFNDDEIKVLNKTKKLILTDNNLKNFIDELGAIAVNLQIKMYEKDKKLANKLSERGKEIKIKDL